MRISQPTQHPSAEAQYTIPQTGCRVPTVTAQTYIYLCLVYLPSPSSCVRAAPQDQAEKKNDFVCLHLRVVSEQRPKIRRKRKMILFSSPTPSLNHLAECPSSTPLRKQGKIN
jgi:hypothetical protein